MDPELTAALAPILRDLSGPAGVLPDVRNEDWRQERRTACAFLYASDGTGMGVWIDLDASASEQVTELADQVQEWAVEALWQLGRSTSWPPCPYHPDSHPLTPVHRNDRAVWICATADTEVSGIGALGSLDQGVP